LNLGIKVTLKSIVVVVAIDDDYSFKFQKWAVRYNVVVDKKVANVMINQAYYLIILNLLKR
jgi:hypothetical protein